MALKDIVIRIVSRLQGDGAAKASTELQQLGTEAEAAADKLDDTSDQLDDTSKSMDDLGRSSDASSKMVGQLSSQLNKVAPGLSSIAGAVPHVAAATAAFIAVKKAIDAVEEAAKNFRMSLAASLDEQLSNEISRHAIAYERMTSEMEKAIAFRRTLSQLEREAAKAASEERIAQLEADRAAAKAKLKPGDDLAAKSIDLDYDARIAAERRRHEIDAESRAAADLEREKQHALELEKEHTEEISKLQSDIAKDLSRLVETLSKQKEAMQKIDESGLSRLFSFLSVHGSGSLMSERRRSKVAQEWEAPIHNAQQRISDNRQRLAELRESRETLRNRKLEMEIRTDIQATQHRTSALTDQRQTTQHSTAASAHQAAIRDAEQRARIDAERERLKQAAAAAETRMSRYDERVAGEQADVSAAQSRLAARPRGRLGHHSAEQNYQQQLRELQGAIAARDKYAADLTRILADLRRKDEELAAQLKRQ